MTTIGLSSSSEGPTITKASASTELAEWKERSTNISLPSEPLISPLFGAMTWGMIPAVTN